MDPNAEKVNVEYKKRTGEFLFEYAGGLVAQTFMIADALERAASADPQKVREAIASLDVSSGYAAMCPGGKVKFGPDGKNIHGHPVGVQWQNGDLSQMWETVAQAVINGLLIGGIYALVSIGVTLIFGVVKIVNFAQGEFVMIGMYISFFLANQFGVDPLVSLVVSMPVLFLVGVLIQHFLIRRVLGPNDMPQIFLTFALSLLLLNLALMLFSANYRTVHTSYSDEAFHIGGLYIPVAKLIAFVVAMALSGALWVFLHTTDLGKAMRAAAQNRDVAMLMGINPNRVFCVALGIALALAGAAGSLLMPFYSAYPFVGQVFVLMAFVAVVLGTLGNVIGALIASLMMGVAESLGIQYVGADSGLIVVFAMLLLTLAFKPTGLGGGRAR
jgi:branched-chain amino acid transport system permease protein